MRLLPFPARPSRPIRPVPGPARIPQCALWPRPVTQDTPLKCISPNHLPLPPGGGSPLFEKCNAEHPTTTLLFTKTQYRQKPPTTLKFEGPHRLNIWGIGHWEVVPQWDNLMSHHNFYPLCEFPTLFSFTYVAAGWASGVSSPEGPDYFRTLPKRLCSCWCFFLAIFLRAGRSDYYAKNLCSFAFEINFAPFLQNKNGASRDHFNQGA